MARTVFYGLILAFFVLCVDAFSLEQQLRGDLGSAGVGRSANYCKAFDCGVSASCASEADDGACELLMMPDSDNGIPTGFEAQSGLSRRENLKLVNRALNALAVAAAAAHNAGDGSQRAKAAARRAQAAIKVAEGAKNAIVAASKLVRGEAVKVAERAAASVAANVAIAIVAAQKANEAFKLAEEEARYSMGVVDVAVKTMNDAKSNAMNAEYKVVKTERLVFIAKVAGRAGANAAVRAECAVEKAEKASAAAMLAQDLLAEAANVVSDEGLN
ncbi:hypothetical protein DQ04_10191010 [Trypanosoma grayi]|uniref:hypothetical protein n=1 Tax=Trypanosoma grayi TaxID=71804 RepID=UPI0004F42E38|nr:hypothetical protein DQ04_10191010 [Trypanosoma grayi]KEG07318.1 hypothetical protein DQ04_10191010 [Trypanosoma grayi]